jgi:3-oxoacyl-[acyl-carrier protein] reductase
MIILTGASGGIGKDILPLLTRLDDVVALYNSKAPKISDKKISWHNVNLSSEEEVKNFCTTLKETSQRITLIHGAALSIDGIAAQFSIDSWDAVMDVNLRGNFLLTRELLLKMIEQKWGRVIHLSSVAGLRGAPGTIAYSAAKTGLLGMSRVLSREYARFGITSNVIALGYFSTGLIETLDEKNRKKILEEIPSKELGNPTNIVDAIEFLMKSEYTNGSVINIDGGI